MIAAEPIVLVVFGSQWVDAIPVLRILSLYVLVASVAYHIGDVYKAIGRPNILLYMTILTIVLMGIALYIGSRFGLEGIAWAYVAAFFTERMLSLVIATRYIDITLADIFTELLPSIKGGLAMAPATMLALYLTSGFSPLIQLICVVLTGVISYLSILWWQERDNLYQLVSVIRRSD